MYMIVLYSFVDLMQFIDIIFGMAFGITRENKMLQI